MVKADAYLEISDAVILKENFRDALIF